MAGWRALAGMTVLLAMTPWAAAETYPLAETVKQGDCYRIHIEMTLSGELKVNRDGKPAPLKLTATASHEFPERVLNVGSGGLLEKTARAYETAKAAINVGDDRSERTLRPERTLQVAQRVKDQLLVYAPSGPLAREELELTSEHFDTLALLGLLPGKAVAVNDSWKIANPVAQALCNFEGLTSQDLVCKFEEVKDNVAHVSVTGTANGIELGAQIKVTVRATYRFDLGSKRFVGLEWEQKDDRDQGPASPASSVTATTKLTRTFIDPPDSLSDVALVPVPEGFEVPPQMLHLDYRDPKGRFELAHGREWQQVSQTPEHLVMRLMEQGDFVAQVTVTPWTTAEKGKHMEPDDFKDAMARTPGWEPETELQAGEVPVPAGEGRWIYRVSALGKMDGTAVMQNFYLVAGPGGEQAVLLFTLTPKKAQKLGDRDLSLAGSVDFPSSRKGTEKPKP
jgi:hypothetical protein